MPTNVPISSHGIDEQQQTYIYEGRPASSYDVPSSCFNNESHVISTPAAAVCSDNCNDDCDDDNRSSDYSDDDVNCHTDSSASDDEIPDLSTDNLKIQIATWSVMNNTSHDSLRELLSILHPHFPDLPCDPRTLLKMPKNVDVSSSAGGLYLHIGCKAGIINRINLWLTITGIESSVYFKKLCQQHLTGDGSVILTLTINIDGLPLTKSAGSSFWPIQAILDQSKNKKPFVIGLFWGVKKPNDVDELLGPTIDELIFLKTEGITVNGQVYRVFVRCVVCDVPARNLMKCTKPYMAFYGCERCIQRGTHKGRVVFPKVDAPLRTHDAFLADDLANKERDEPHVKEKSPFLRLEYLDLVKSFPLDYMHLVCLGVMRKLINCWLKGSLPHRLPSQQVGRLNEHLDQLRNEIPLEFSRKPRSTSHVAN